jgi:hypothetical protein
MQFGQTEIKRNIPSTEKNRRKEKERNYIKVGRSKSIIIHLKKEKVKLLANVGFKRMLFIFLSFKIKACVNEKLFL